jgi:hypothetical protein
VSVGLERPGYGDNAFNSRSDGLYVAQKRSTTDARKAEFVEAIQSDLPCPSVHASRQFLIFRNYP